MSRAVVSAYGAGLALLLCGIACSDHQKPRSSEASIRGETVEQTITGPTIIAIVPANAGTLLTADEQMANDLVDIQLALADAKLCLAPLEPKVSLVHADRLVLISEGKRTLVYPQLKTGASDPSGEAVILARQDGDPRTVLRGTSSIGGMILSELADYFLVATCDASEYPQ